MDDGAYVFKNTHLRLILASFLGAAPACGLLSHSIQGHRMKIIDRERDAISLEPDMDRTAFWLTIHGVTKKDNRVVRLSVLEAKLLASALLSQAEDVEMKSP